VSHPELADCFSSLISQTPGGVALAFLGQRLQQGVEERVEVGDAHEQIERVLRDLGLDVREALGTPPFGRLLEQRASQRLGVTESSRRRTLSSMAPPHSPLASTAAGVESLALRASFSSAICLAPRSHRTTLVGSASRGPACKSLQTDPRPRVQGQLSVHRRRARECLQGRAAPRPKVVDRSWATGRRRR
jgi:hypothetical protein